ncbi:MAG TPA: zf-HC2 domain-containing protein [Vicinamibacterales bacterium]|nr:zf-HC2 domain-containing protein [Vicinamibacterales bacterium]
MRCSELDSLVVPFVDGEAAPPDRAHVEAHLSACPPCRDRVEAERQAREAVHGAREHLREHAPPALRQRCAALCAPRHTRRWIPVSLAAAAALLAGVIWLGTTDAGTPVLAAQLTLDHVKCAAFNSRRVSGSPGQLAEYWRTRYGWPIVVPAGRADLLRLSGVRRCGSSHGQTAHIMYMHEGRPVSLFVARDDGRTPRTVDIFGHEAVVWSSGDRTYVLVGEEPREEMQLIAASLRKEIPEP